MALVLAGVLGEHHQDTECRNRRPGENCAHALDQVRRALVSPVNEFEAPSRKPYPEREEWRSEQALQAQWDQTAWAFWAAMAASFGIVVGAVGIVFIKQTLDSTRAAVSQGAKGVEAAMIAANAAAEANQLMRENAIADRRAWLPLEDAELTHPTQFTEDGAVIKAKITVKNLGRTPAKSVEVMFESFYAHTNFKEDVDRFRERLLRHPTQLGYTLFPEDTLTQTLRWIDPKEKISPAINTRPDGARKFSYTIFIGVSYRIEGDPNPHITLRIYKKHNVLAGFSVPEGKIQQLPPMPFLAGETT